MVSLGHCYRGRAEPGMETVIWASSVSQFQSGARDLPDGMKMLWPSTELDPAAPLICCLTVSKTLALCIASELTRLRKKVFNFTLVKAKGSQQVARGELQAGRPCAEGHTFGCLSVRVRTPLLLLRRL